MVYFVFFQSRFKDVTSFDFFGGVFKRTYVYIRFLKIQKVFTEYD